jgi:hypothetical protein
MEFYGISGKANNLIKTCFQDKSQRILVDFDLKKYYSEWESVTDGVPQGSVIGPLVILLHVNNVPNVISDISNPVPYADDTSLIIRNSDSQMFGKDINTIILQLNRRFNSNLLILNMEKNLFPSIFNQKH